MAYQTKVVLTNKELHELQYSFMQAKVLGHERFLFRGQVYLVNQAQNVLSSRTAEGDDCVAVHIIESVISLDSEDKTVPVLGGIL